MKLVIMKYLNSKDLPCYKRMTADEVANSDNDGLEMMELEKDEMLFSGEMRKHLWTKVVNSSQYKRLLDIEAKHRMEILDHLIELFND